MLLMSSDRTHLSSDAQRRVTLIFEESSSVGTSFQLSATHTLFWQKRKDITKNDTCYVED